MVFETELKIDKKNKIDASDADVDADVFVYDTQFSTRRVRHKNVVKNSGVYVTRDMNNEKVFFAVKICDDGSKLFARVNDVTDALKQYFPDQSSEIDHAHHIASRIESARESFKEVVSKEGIVAEPVFISYHVGGFAHANNVEATVDNYSTPSHYQVRTTNYQAVSAEDAETAIEKTRKFLHLEEMRECNAVSSQLKSRLKRTEYVS